MSKMPLCAYFIQPFAKRNYLRLLAIHIEKTYVENEYARALMSVSALLTNPNQKKVPFTPTPSDGTEGAACVCSLQGTLTDFPSVTAYDALGMYSEGAASHPTVPSPTSSHSRVCLLSPLAHHGDRCSQSLPPPATHTQHLLPAYGGSGLCWVGALVLED